VEGLITIADPSGAVAALLDAAVQVQQTEPSSALVGGVAVICRLATAHRATLDADTVVEEREPGVLEVLRARPDTSVPADPDSQGVLIHGALVEIIEVAPVLPADVAAVDDPRDRLFVAAHRWALDTAEPADIDTAPASGRRRLAIATPAGLAATKTHALVGRRGGRQDKMGSDLLDLLLLFEHFDDDGGLTAALRAAPYGLGGLVAEQLAGLLGDPQRRTRAIRLAGQAVGSNVSASRLVQAFARLLDPHR
jgi:hypothetical protein